eukprot:TRINITY_DN7542_c1_g1_i1.p1 TRINITY_DN7542_c1_g1~~TRINITY_DN7542_c1_g1_i1.p1  ORF type:complete len:860 (-),score=195.22 TRINITY_DN7542_c1_g1_i1:109-2613(-)
MADVDAAPAPSPESPAENALPNRVRTEPEALEDAEAEARGLPDPLDVSALVPRLELALATGNSASAPPPRIPAPPPKMRPPQWLAPAPPPPAQMDDYVDDDEEASIEGNAEDEEVSDGVRLSKLEEFLALEQGMQHNCRNLPVTIACWIFFVLLVFHHGQARQSYEAAEFIENAVLGAVVPGTSPALRLGSVSDVHAALRWTEEGLVRTISDADTTHGKLGASGVQAVVGFIRIQQVKGRPTATCAHLDSELQSAHGGECHPRLPSTDALGPYGINVSSKETAFRPSAPDTFTAWVEVGRAAATTAEHFRMLRNGGWLDLNTHEIKVDAVFVAAAANIYSRLSINFILHREGLMEQTLKVQPIQANTYSHWSHAFFDLIFVVTLFVLMKEIVNDVLVARQRGQLKAHLLNPYTALDLGLCAFGLCLVFYFWLLLGELDSLAESVLEATTTKPPFAVIEAPQRREIEMVVKSEEYYRRMDVLIERFAWISTQSTRQRLFSFWYAMGLAGRFTNSLSGQPRIAVLIQVLRGASDFLLHYLVVAFIVCFSFCHAGYILFGEQLLGWSSFGRCISSLFLVLFGHFDYQELHDVAPWLASFWFWGVYIFMVLLLLNVLKAAVVHRYFDVKKRLGEAGAGVFQQLREKLGVFRFRNSYDGAQKSVPYDVLLASIAEHRGDITKITRVAKLETDRRLRTREDLAREEKDPRVSVDFLMDRGCDQAAAEHLLERCTRWSNSISMTDSPEHRLVVQAARQMHACSVEAALLRTRLRERVNFASASIDRIDLKHAKCMGMAKRIRKAQEIPRGWEVHMDEENRRYLRHTETGLTSWTLPRNMIR